MACRSTECVRRTARSARLWGCATSGFPPGRRPARTGSLRASSWTRWRSATSAARSCGGGSSTSTRCAGRSTSIPASCSRSRTRAVPRGSTVRGASEMAVRTPFYQVKAEGVDITSWVSAVTVVEDDRQADNVSLTVADPHLVYADALMEGALVEVDMGYAEPGEHALLLKAIVTKVETSYPQDGVPLITVKGEDRSITMGLVEHKKHWRDMTITQIVKEVAGPYGFGRVQAELSPDPKTDKKPIYQDGKTDLAFLQELAEQHKSRCFVELDDQGQEVLYFIPERKIVQLRRPETLTFRYRKGPDSNLISFSPGFDASYIDRFRELNDVDAKGEVIKSRDKPAPEPELWPLDKGRVRQAGEEGPKIE